jgi:hypothetical protein
MNQDLKTLNEIYTKLELVVAELRGRGGLHDRISALEAKQEMLVNAYWKGIGVIAGLAAASGFIGTLFGYVFFK